MVNRDALSGFKKRVIDSYADGVTSSVWGKFLQRPLEDAARSGHEEFTGKLCEAGAHFGSAFDCAAEEKQLGTIRVLAKHLSQRESVSYADVSTEAASASECANVSPLILADSGKLKRAVVCAAEEKNTTTVEYLLEAGAGIDAGDAVLAAFSLAATSASAFLLAASSFRRSDTA